MKPNHNLDHMTYAEIVTRTKALALVAIIVLLAILAGGCTVGQAVPKLRLTVDPKTHAVVLENPKDTTVKNFRAEVTASGSSIVTFDSLTTVMNPDVITTTGEAQAKMITATGQVVLQAVQAAPQAMAILAKKP